MTLEQSALDNEIIKNKYGRKNEKQKKQTDRYSIAYNNYDNSVIYPYVLYGDRMELRRRSARQGQGQGKRDRYGCI